MTLTDSLVIALAMSIVYKIVIEYLDLTKS